jgi:uridine phosphorylase
MPARKRSRVSRRKPTPPKVKKNTASNFASNPFPILEYDRARIAIIEPRRILKPIDMPKHCVLCFFQDVIDDLVRNGARQIDKDTSEMGEHPVYEIEVEGKRLAVAHPRIGASMAVAMLERCIARGARKFIACGGAGVLDSKIAVGHVIVPNAAIRDEGTSYHYLPAGREVKPHPRALAAIEKTLRRNRQDYIVAKTWTTDGLFRETRERINARKREGCLTVEMEASAFFAVAQFRGVPFGQILYGGDDLGGKWDHRNWTRHQIRERLFAFAAEACLIM